MLASWRKPAQPAIKANANLFALVAVVLAFVALMMGMTVPSYPFEGTSVDLPKVAWPVSMPYAMREDAIVVTVMRYGDVFLDNDRVAPERLVGMIREDAAHGSASRVFIRADARVYYRDVKEVLDAVHAAGLVDVSFMADQRRRQTVH